MRLIVIFTFFFSLAAIANECPEGFLKVSENKAYGIDKSFCVMKFPAKRLEKGIPVSRQEGFPWVDVKYSEAKSACQKLGKGYDLIDNAQWLTIADEIIGNVKNWSSNEVGVGYINKGHSDNNPAKACDTKLDNVQGDCNKSGMKFDQKRTHYLKSNEEIWDFSGNLWEWVKWDYEMKKHPFLEQNRWRELDRIPDEGLGKGLEKKWLVSAKNPKLNTLNMVGALWAEWKKEKNLAMIRGGRFHRLRSAGILTVDFSFDKEIAFYGLTFRCVKN